MQYFTFHLQGCCSWLDALKLELLTLKEEKQKSEERQERQKTEAGCTNLNKIF